MTVAEVFIPYPRGEKIRTILSMAQRLSANLLSHSHHDYTHRVVTDGRDGGGVGSLRLIKISWKKRELHTSIYA